MRLLTGKHRVQYEELQCFAQRSATALGLREEQIARMEAEITRLREDATRERQRADNAVDALLAVRGVPPVTPQPPGPPVDFDPLREDPDEVARIEQEMREWGVGTALERAGST